MNSAYQIVLFSSDFSENIILGGGSVLNSEASTFYWESIGCTNCNITQGSGSGATKGLGFVGYQNTTYGPSSVRFKSTALGSIDAPEPLQKLWGDPQVFSSDAYTWVQPTTGQDATELAAILPNASTATPGLTTQFLANIQEQQVPIIPGVLVEAVPDAGVGGVNQLFSPIDGLPIALDVNGSPRVYANGTRNIGAVQNSDAPSLSATSGDSQVTLNWSPTAVGQVVGYEVCTSATPLTDPLTGACPAAPAAVGPSETSEVVSGLTNGAPYWFAVRGTSTIWSKVATATPMGPLGVAQPTAATIGDGSVQVYWAAPATTGGYTGLLSYNLVYRPIGTQAWLVGPQGITAQTTLLGGLVNGTTYEIGVLAQTDDGGHSPTAGTITATPQAAPMLSYATLSSWPQNTPLTLTPTVGQLQGSGAYTHRGRRSPRRDDAQPSTGVISGTPTTQQSTSATIRLTDGTTGLFTDATVPLSIVAPSPSPQTLVPRDPSNGRRRSDQRDPDPVRDTRRSSVGRPVRRQPAGRLHDRSRHRCHQRHAHRCARASRGHHDPGLLGRRWQLRHRAGTSRPDAVLDRPQPAIPGQHPRHRRRRDHRHANNRGPLERRCVQHRLGQPAGRDEPGPGDRRHQRHAADGEHHRLHYPLQHRGERLRPAARVCLLGYADQCGVPDDHADLPGGDRECRREPVGVTYRHRANRGRRLFDRLGLAPARAEPELDNGRHQRRADGYARKLPGRD